jgi:hypothetical protein
VTKHNCRVLSGRKLNKKVLMILQAIKKAFVNLQSKGRYAFSLETTVEK